MIYHYVRIQRYFITFIGAKSDNSRMQAYILAPNIKKIATPTPHNER